MTGGPSELRWLVLKAAETPDLQLFAYALLEHLSSALGCRLAAAVVQDGTDRRFAHYSSEPITPVELAGLRARVSGLAEVEEGTALVRSFRCRQAFGTFYLEPEPDSGGHVIEAALALLDVLTALSGALKEASHDSLTGLLNRRALAEGLGSMIELGNRYGSTFSLAMLDLDNFKWFNDTYGHAEGDELLRRLAGVLSSSVRKADLVARYGGDEFLLVLPHTDPNQAEALLRRVARELDAFLHRYGATGIELGFSAGVSHFPDDGRDADTLIRRADEKLYRAKQSA